MSDVWSLVWVGVGVGGGAGQKPEEVRMFLLVAKNKVLQWYRYCSGTGTVVLVVIEKQTQ